jgi:hypothetical protein
MGGVLNKQGHKKGAHGRFNWRVFGGKWLSSGHQPAKLDQCGLLKGHFHKKVCEDSIGTENEKVPARLGEQELIMRSKNALYTFSPNFF